MNQFKKTILKLHKYLAYIIFVQFSLWVLGGVVFAIIPFNEIIKSEGVVTKPVVNLPSGWQANLSLLNDEGIINISTFVSATGPAYRLHLSSGAEITTSIDGKPLPPVLDKQVLNFAKNIYKGKGEAVYVRYLTSSQYRLGIVDEMYGKKGVWQVGFADDYDSRLYFDGESGEYLKARNKYWVIYDFFWRLHTMDYKNGEDINNLMLRLSSIAAFIFVLSGVLLSAYSLRNKASRFIRKYKYNR
ncbi:hypothetical protein [Aeromonas veronii]|uniref:hypothetical protein n=1 Tax=Aeromonas veronii TaxID=654 RepID=UPI003B9DD3CC